MLVIRLSRTGRKKLANYRIVAADKRRAATGKVVANLGHYNPHTKEAVIKKDELEGYIKNGAQPSGAVIKLLKKQKIGVPKWAESNLVVRKRAPKQKGDGSEAAAAQSAPDAKADDKAEAAEKKTESEAKSDDKPVASEKGDSPETATKAEPVKEKSAPEGEKSDQ